MQDSDHATWTYDEKNSQLPEKIEEDEDKPNRQARRQMQRLYFRSLSKSKPRTAYSCGTCGLSCVGPSSNRCQCKPAQPKHEARNPMQEVA